MKIVAKVKTNHCPKCKQTEIETLYYQDTVDFRGLEFDVDNLEMSKCSSCGYNWKSEEQIRKNQETIKATYATHRDNLRKSQGLLSGDEIAKIRNYFNLSQRQASLVFGGGFNSFNKYESGEVLQSVAMDRLLKLTYVFKKQGLMILNTITDNKHLDIDNLTVACSLQFQVSIPTSNLRVSLPQSFKTTTIEGFKINDHNNFGLLSNLSQTSSTNKTLTTPYNSKVGI